MGGIHRPGLVFLFCFLVSLILEIRICMKELSPGSYCIPAVTISIYVNPE